MIKYSDDFKVKLKEVYPEFTEFHRLAEENSINLLGELSEMLDGPDNRISSEEVISMFEQETEAKRIEAMNNLYAKAKRVKDKEDLWAAAIMDFDSSQDGSE